MKEIEVKILEVNRRFVEKSLFELGAKKIFDAEVLTLFFDFEDGRIINQKDVLRLRKNQEEIEITYKKVHTTQNAKTAEEFSVQVSSMEIMRKILEKLGLNVIDKMQKHRISYALNDARFDFDCYSGDYGYIPEFLEIEAKNIDLIYRFAELLGFKTKDCLPWSTTDLIKYYAFKKTEY